MSVIIVLILASLVIGLSFLAAFVWSVRSGQYDDTVTPSMRILVEDAAVQNTFSKTGGLVAPSPVSQPTPGRPTNI
jgi:cbb3-type cytochrome oxidase maturation protein